MDEFIQPTQVSNHGLKQPNIETAWSFKKTPTRRDPYDQKKIYPVGIDLKPEKKVKKTVKKRKAKRKKTTYVKKATLAAV